MEPVKLGRTLGIGMRVASGMLRDRAARTGHSGTQSPPATAAPADAPASESAAPTAAAPAAAALEEQPAARAELTPPVREIVRPPVRTVAPPQPPRTEDAHASVKPAASTPSRSAEFGRMAGQTLRASRQVPSKTRMAVHGVKGFGRAFWGPFRHASGILWMEITGLFFTLFALFFAQNAYYARSAWQHGAEHDHFILYVALTVIFFWFAASSFLRAHKRSKRRG